MTTIAPFKKNFDFSSRGGRGRRNRRIRRGAPSNKSLHKSILKIQRGIELKQHDLFLNAQVIDNVATNTLGCLNIIPIGTNETNRIGSDLHCTSVQFRARFTKDAVATVNVPLIRHMIFWDRQCNGALPLLADVLDLTVVTEPVLAPYNQEKQQRFKILYDNTFSMSVGTAVTAELNNLMFKKKKRALGRITKYNDVGTYAGAITDIQTNSLCFIMVSTAAANGPLVSCGYRVCFKDS